MMLGDCPNCQKADMKYTYTDYYDFDVYVCPECGHEVSMPQDAYLDDESLEALYGDDYFDDDYGDDEQ